MKIKSKLALCVLVLVLAACAAAPAATTVPAAPTTTTVPAAPAATAVPALSKAVFKTSIGEFVYGSAKFVSEANTTRPAPGCKLLLVYLEPANGKPVDLQAYMDAHMQVFIKGDDGSNTLSTMGGFVDNRFAIGFQVPENVKTYQLVWEENDPVTVMPE